VKSKLTPADITPAVKHAVRAYLLARAHAELQREKMEAVDRELLAAREWHTAAEWLKGRGGDRLTPTITDPDRIYLMDDSEAVEYYALRQARVDAMGLDLPPDCCPALMAEELERKAARLVVETSAEMVGEDEKFIERLYCRLVHTNRWVDLIVGLVVNLPDFRQ
jgi:hypothetical protein